MSKPIIRIHNIETDEIIDREMTDLEYQQFLIDQEKIAFEKAEFEAKNAAREAVLAKLGLTAEEAASLLA